MSAEDQVREVSAADVLIGFAGSTLHNALFMDAGTRVIEIGDDPNFHKPNPQQFAIAKMRGQKLAFVPGYQGADIRDAPQIILDIFAAIKRL